MMHRATPSPIVFSLRQAKKLSEDRGLATTDGSDTISAWRKATYFVKE